MRYLSFLEPSRPREQRPMAYPRPSAFASAVLMPLVMSLRLGQEGCGAVGDSPWVTSEVLGTTSDFWPFALRPRAARPYVSSRSSTPWAPHTTKGKRRGPEAKRTISPEYSPLVVGSSTALCGAHKWVVSL